MTSSHTPDDLLDMTVVDRSGERIGRVERIYLDAQSRRPSFIGIRTAVPSRTPSIVPLAESVFQGDALALPVAGQRVKNAPPLEPAGANGGLTRSQEQALYVFYGLDPAVEGLQQLDRESRADQAPADAMTRSEEQLNIRKESQPTVRAKLTKHLVTEEVQVTVPVTREEYRIEYEPVTPGETPSARPDEDVTDEGLVLYAERVVVKTENVPVERVRLNKEAVTEDRVVTEQVQREKIALDEDKS
jgi:uncharacterized protein (TIGR02271 family)